MSPVRESPQAKHKSTKPTAKIVTLAGLQRREKIRSSFGAHSPRLVLEEHDIPQEAGIEVDIHMNAMPSWTSSVLLRHALGPSPATV